MKIRKNESGFTLIELIAVVALLGIISVFMFPSLARIMNDNNKAPCEYYEKAMVEAARSYINKESYDILEANNGFPSNYKLTTEQLISLDYLSQFSDKRTTIRSGSYVIVNYDSTTKSYTYVPHLTCIKVDGTVIYSK